MPVKTTSWDPAEHLDSPQAIAAYLDAALEEGEAALIAATIGDVARAPRQEAIARSARAEASSQTGEMKELDDVR
jgi:probable addiction module antidote protein